MRPLLFANFLAPNMSSVYAFVATRLGEQLGGSSFIEGTSLDQLRDGPVDVAFLCGLPYVRLRQERPPRVRALAAPVLSEPRYGGQPIYFSDVIVRRESTFRSFADLRGCSWAHSREDSFSGCLLARYNLRQLGETEAFFGRVTYSGRHQASIRAVIEGEVEASAIDSHVLAVERRRDRALDAKLRVIGVLGPSPIPPVVVSARVPAEIAGRLRDGLCRLHADPVSRQALRQGLIRRFDRVDDRTYDDIRRKVAAVEGPVPGGHQLATLGV